MGINYIPSHFGINLVLKGTGTYRDHQERVHPLHPGCVFQRIPGRRHTIRYTEGQQILECWISMGGATYRQLRSLHVIRGAPVIVCADPQLISDGYKRFWEVLTSGWSGDAPKALLRLQELLLDVYASIGGTRGRYHEQVRQACAVLERSLDTPADPRLVATQVGMHYETFRKAFAAETGLSPRAYHQRRRMERAAVLLHAPVRTLAEIAEELGYSDAFAFSAQFKRTMGESPENYRRHQGLRW